MNSINRVKTTKMFWHQCRNMVVRFEREIDTRTLVFGEGKA